MISVDTKQPSSSKTPNAKAGYATRLSKFLSVCGIKNYGRMATLGSLAGTQPATIRQRLVEDKPPLKERHFDSLVEGLSVLANEVSNLKVKTQSLKDYLLHGTPLSQTAQNKIEKAYAQQQSEIEEKALMAEPDFTPLGEPGFGDRLDTALLYAGINQGKLAKIARWLDKTVAGVKYVFDNDKPFKQLADHEALVKHLKNSIEVFTSQEVLETDLSNFLLFNEPKLFRDFERVETYYEQDTMSYFDVVQLGESYFYISDVGKTIGIDPFKDLPRNDLQKVIERSLFILKNAGGRRDESTSKDIIYVIRSAKLGTL